MLFGQFRLSLKTSTLRSHSPGVRGRWHPVTLLSLNPMRMLQDDARITPHAPWRVLPPSGAPGAADSEVCVWCPLKRCADQAAKTFSVQESARWRAAPSRHHALQASTGRLLIATYCTVHPPLAHRSLLWVREFAFFLLIDHLQFLLV